MITAARKGLAAAGLIGVMLGASTQAAVADSGWPNVMESCRALVQTGAKDGELERDCYLIMIGVRETLSIMGGFYPLGKTAGFCMVPGTTPLQLASALVTHADMNPDCERLAAMSMCISSAMKAAFGKGCDM